MSRRSFLRHASLLTTGLFTGLLQPAWSRNLNSALREAEGVQPADLAGEEEFWFYVQQAFTGTPNIINLNSGGVSPCPRVVAEAMKQNFDYINEAPSLYMWRQLDQGREPLRRSFAAFAGCDHEEIAFNRNTSEGLDTVIFGLPLRRGDEVVLCRQDYNHAVFSWQQREKREGVKLNWVDLRLPSEDEAYLVRQYVEAFTPNTRVVLLTHMINWNGQLLPVARIAAEARKRGILVLVDGAHSFAQLDFRIADLGADFFVTSLHKWTYAPIGTGALWMRKERAAELWPLHGTDRLTETNIRKFESLGTRPFYIEQATGKAVEFNEGIGLARKQQRLHYLKNYWMERVKDLPGIRFGTSTDPKWGCAIGLVSFEGKKPQELDAFLFNNYKVHCTTTEWNGLSGVRITPNVFTTTKQLDVLVEGIRAYAMR
ncbi:aminotransferase class V-fold PLP-dependent enzyme [Flaviaesturariibacter flavus]|uniref:Aminotransferase class V-fold PLP-dependent enzyme n=1 Tax=Flaviaesturariibacter flavus TaxID=2502780 RepID=A0A4R1BJW5_9BACT|nr:aminotransferase class V-fold PLP-dependent enzyme [Flaviaesturariibacter flavus]TCJ17641.1 aminotransferase class V-fold PLP-dependent enzyme [Flaviaesturariibacter flavus]